MPAPPESFYRRQPHEREVEVTDAKSVKLFIAPESPPGKGGYPAETRRTPGGHPAATRRPTCRLRPRGGGEDETGEDVAGRYRSI
jgi:hypothetical protein